MPIKVFISSRIAGMQKIRDRVSKVISEHKFKADRSENWPADEHHTRNVCERHVRESDAVVFIFGRYYSQMTEFEYQEAIRSKKPRLIFIKESCNREIEMESFLTRIGQGDNRFRAKYKDIRQLARGVNAALSNLVVDKFQSNKERSIIERARVQCDDMNDYLIGPQFLPQGTIAPAVNVSDLKLEIIKQKKEIEKILRE